MQYKQIFTVALLLFYVAYISLTIALGQAKDVVELKSNGCEIDEANFSVIENDAKQTLFGKTGFLIVVARRGKGDAKPNLNQQRLSATKEYIVNKLRFPADKLILAIGEKVKGNGRVEFYINGSLTHVILPKSNFSLCTECCVAPEFDRKGKRINKPKPLPKLVF